MAEDTTANSSNTAKITTDTAERPLAASAESEPLANGHVASEPPIMPEQQNGQKLVSRPAPVTQQTPAFPVSPPPASPVPARLPASSVPSIIQLPDETEDDRQPSALFKDVSGIYPKVPSEHWVEEEDFWQTRTHIAMTGRAPVPRPRPLPLKPPQRFRPVERWKSMLVLALVIGLAALACIGVIALGISGMSLLQPGHTATATPHPTQTVVPTQTPHKKK